MVKKRKLSHREMENLKNIENLLHEKNEQAKMLFQSYNDFKKEKDLFDDIQMTDHAYQRVMERLSIDNKKEALKHIKSLLRKATKIGTTVSEDGKESILYGKSGVAIYLSTDSKYVVTVTKEEYVAYQPIRQQVRELHHKEIRKLDRKERARLRRLDTLKLEADLEIAECNYRIHRTRSLAVKNVCNARIKAVKERLVELENEIIEIQSNKRQIAKSMVAVV